MFEKQSFLVFILCIICLIPSTPIYPEEPDNFFELSLDELLEAPVKIASRHKESFANAPSIVTIITRREIENRQPRSPGDLLASIPGFTNQTRNLGESLFQVRGIHSVNDTILLMIDGHPLNDRIFGTMIYVLESIPLEIIERIEVIRGPGSAVYGANAFYAVINIITIPDSKEATHKTRVISKLSSAKTIQGVVTVKKSNPDKEEHLIASAAIGSTDGQSHYFKDRSGVEGNTFFPQRRFNFYVNYKKKALTLAALYNREELGPFVGIAYRLNQRTLRKYTTCALKGEVEFSLNDHLDITGKVYWDSFIYDCLWEFMPAQLMPPNGYLMKGYARDFKLGTDWSGTYHFSSRHRLLMGAFYEYIGLTDAASSDNLSDPYLFKDNVEPWLSNGKEINSGFYMQDNYFITPGLQMVLGVRYDRHTAYGESWNPRGGITWTVGKKSNFKLLYGQAFHAPAFWDIYSNSPDQVRNPDLRPEKIQTVDIEFNTSLLKNIFARVNFYQNRITDLILTAAITLDGTQTSIKQNLGKTRVKGVEAEIRGSFAGGRHAVLLNGFYNSSRDIFHDQGMPWIPRFGMGLIVNTKWGNSFSSNMQVRHIGELGRELGD
ncbi:MAG: TonB-dependent receptor, partial [bacterium]|nr:TonB-dependent receptor [bacterium]